MPTKIETLLPVYQKATGDTAKYVALRTIIIDGHEVAWMEYSDGLKIGPVRLLLCECHFTPGVGYEIGSDGRAMFLSEQENCIHMQTAVYLRHLELHKEYEKRYEDPTFSDLDASDNNIAEIILDLIKKAETGELIGRHEMAEQWNGKMFQVVPINLQTIADIIGVRFRLVRKVAGVMSAAKKITLTDGVTVWSYGSI